MICFIMLAMPLLFFVILFKSSQAVDPLFQVIDPVHMELKWVGLFLAAHKYFEVDRRRGNEMSWKYEPRVFHKHFPIPRLRNLHPQVSDACHEGLVSCIREISATALDSYSLSQTEPSLAAAIPPDVPPYYPLSSELELFQYRTTATYFMCWYTMKRDEILMNHMGEKNCLENLHRVKEKEWADLDTTDYRNGTYGYPWLCAEIQFCPDPCYGRTTEGNIPSYRALRDDKENPCRKLSDKTCKWEPEENRDLESLRRNRFNITCRCYKDKRGFKWNSQFKMCVDIDECTESKTVKCESNRICQNAVGSFACVCRMGTKYDREKQLCVEHVPLPAHNFHRTARVKARRQKTALRRFIEYIFGLRDDT